MKKNANYFPHYISLLQNCLYSYRFMPGLTLNSASGSCAMQVLGSRELSVRYREKKKVLLKRWNVGIRSVRPVLGICTSAFLGWDRLWAPIQAERSHLRTQRSCNGAVTKVPSFLLLLSLYRLNKYSRGTAAPVRDNDGINIYGTSTFRASKVLVDFVLSWQEQLFDLAVSPVCYDFSLYTSYL